MGFVVFSMSVDILPKSLISLLKLVDIILYSFSVLLHRLGLNPSFDWEVSSWENEDRLFSTDPTRSMLAEATLVKTRLPTVEYMSFVNRKYNCSGGGAAPPPECVVCLQLLEAMDEVRELGNCCQAFHVGCIDRWVDLGRFSCPLCRAALLPSGGRKMAGGGVVAFLKALLFGMFRLINRS